MKLKAWQQTALWIVGLPLLLVLLLAALPTHDELVIPDADLKVGAPARGAAGGVQVPMPQPVANSANPSTPQKVELGRLLFFDATVSTNNQLACASCHNPALGFTDGQTLAQGSVTLTRNTPALYGVAYAQNLFWDGRATTLEEQSLTPLTNHAEMAVQPAQLEAKLAAMPRYAELFGSGFNSVTGDFSKGGSGFLIENGEITYPISEITVAGNIKDMFKEMLLANDLEFKSRTNSPTIRINNVSIAGK